MNVIFLGPPGAGKGTVAARLKQRFDLDHLSTGDMLRCEIKGKTELGNMAKSYIDQGKLVPDQVIIDMVANRLKAAEKGVLFDGFPRTVQQAEALDGIAPIHAVINLAAEPEVVVARISSRRICSGCGEVFNTRWHAAGTCDKCGAPLYTRADDTPETARKRYDVYMQETLPLIGYYEGKGVLTTLDADRSTEEVVEEISHILESV